jgi:PilZ domain
VIEDPDAPRQNRVFFRGFVYSDSNLTAVECVVRDISDTGARLQFAAPQVVTDFLDLHIPVKGQIFHAHVRWRDGAEIGVAFREAKKRKRDTSASTGGSTSLRRKYQC